MIYRADANAKPNYLGGATSVSSATTFNNWWNTVGVTSPTANSNLQMAYSITLSNGTETDGRIYTFNNQQFFPIDGGLLGNENQAHNYFFTYEVCLTVELSRSESV